MAAPADPVTPRWGGMGQKASSKSLVPASRLIVNNGPGSADGFGGVIYFRDPIEEK